MTAAENAAAKEHEVKRTEIELAKHELQDDKAAQYALYAPYDASANNDHPISTTR